MAEKAAKRKSNKRPRVVPKAAASRRANVSEEQRTVRDPQPGTRLPGEDERIAERRSKALALRKAGASYRAIARECGVDVATAWSDIQTELAAIMRDVKESASDVKTLELARYDDWTLALQAKVRSGDVKAVQVLTQVSARRSRLLGIDAPIEFKNIDTRRLNDEELALLMQLLAKATGVQTEG